ncbi:MAG: RNA polymerase sigma factor [Chthoniobacterales bacterium]|jgi:RNA polymerase sigma factor (sigma-70 family)
MSPDDFSALIAGARRFDEAAAEELVRRIYPIVIRIVRNHLPRRELEEDLAQEVFLKIFSKLQQFRADVPFEHWVSRIAVNTCIDHLRKQKNRPEFRLADFTLEQQAALENLYNSATLPPERSPEEVREILHRLMLALKGDERLVIQLMYLEEKSVAEICDLTGWKPSKIKVTAFRARQKLAATLKRLER